MSRGFGSATDYSEADPFTQAFYEIDTDNDGIITRANLEEFVRKKECADESLVRVSIIYFIYANHLTNNG